jgi:hypothetical protein
VLKETDLHTTYFGKPKEKSVLASLDVVGRRTFKWLVSKQSKYVTLSQISQNRDKKGDIRTE